MKKYQKPLFHKVTGLDFVLAKIRVGWIAVCRQCCSCHGCR